MESITFDSHKRYTLSHVETPQGRLIEEVRIAHHRGEIVGYLKKFSQGSTVAVETIGNWYWIADEIEAAGMQTALVHSRKAKLMMGKVNKTDRLDVRGLANLQRMGMLPEVWIPPADLRDKRDLPRTRMVFSQMRTKLKNRIHATLAKYALGDFGETTDIFGVNNLPELKNRIAQLPRETRFSTRCVYKELMKIQETMDRIEAHMKRVFQGSRILEFLMTLPGVGFILGIVIFLEMGNVERFGSAPQFASYAGTTPRVQSSGGKTRFGPLRKDVNRYLKWAFVEAANAVCRFRRQCSDRHVNRIYERIRARKGHDKAIGAVARHLAEAAYCVVKKGEAYKDPGIRRSSSEKA
jgi:transposase